MRNMPGMACRAQPSKMIDSQEQADAAHKNVSKWGKLTDASEADQTHGWQSLGPTGECPGSTDSRVAKSCAPWSASSHRGGTSAVLSAAHGRTASAFERQLSAWNGNRSSGS